MPDDAAGTRCVPSARTWPLRLLHKISNREDLIMFDYQPDLDESFTSLLAPVPVREARDNDETIACAYCEEVQGDDREVYSDTEGWLCHKCVLEIIEEARAEARDLVKKCKITQPLLAFSEQYDEHAYLCHLRHNYTNYDELIEDLDRDSIWDQVVYHAVCDRIESLLCDAIEYEDEEDEEVAE